jgi:hypothetical protein
MRREDRLLHCFPFSLADLGGNWASNRHDQPFSSADPMFSIGVPCVAALVPAQGSSSALAPAQAGAHPRASILTFVRPRRRLAFAPTAGCRGRRAQMLSRLPRPGPPVDAEHRFAMTGLALTASSTTAGSSCRGLLTRAATRVRRFSSPRSCGRGAARSRRCAPACWRARSPAHCGAAAGRPPRSKA